MIYKLFLCTCLTLLLVTTKSNSQGVPTADAYFLYFTFNAERAPKFCLPVDSATGISRCYGVDYDSLGRPTQVTQLFFGNFNSRAEWTIMKFRYDTLPSGSIAVSRTWHDPGGMPLQIGVAYGEVALYNPLGNLIMYTLTDKEGNRVEQVNAVTRSMFRKKGENRFMQEWRYSNNKQFNGSESDHWNSQFSSLDKRAWFRIFEINEQGFVLEEEVLDLAQRPIAFQGGEEIRQYRRNECGQILSVSFITRDQTPMTNSSGVARIDYQYDAAGRMVEWIATDLGGDPKGREEFAGAARMSRMYRSFDGYLLQEHFFDAEGNIMELKQGLEG